METRLTVTAGAILSLLLIVGIAAGCGGSTTTVTQTVTGKTTGSTTTSPSSTESRTTGLADSGTYSGTAKSLVLSLQESKYDEVVSSKEVTKPSAAKRPGFQSGWNFAHRETTPSTTNEIDVTIYVYDSHAHAMNAYDNACRQCKNERVAQGVLVKYEVEPRNKKHPSVTALGTIATCRNLYVAVISVNVPFAAVSANVPSTAAGIEKPSDLAYDAGSFIGGIYEKAMEQGMARCNATKTTTKPKTVTQTITKTTRAKPRSHVRRFGGNGGKTLPPVTVHRDSTLSWTNDGMIFQIFAGDSGVPVNSQAHSGNTFLAAGTYTLQVNAVGNWTIRIAPG